MFSRRVSNRLISAFQRTRINGGCDERVLINHVHHFVVFARSLAVFFLCFKSSSLLRCVFVMVMVVRLLANR